MKSVPSSPSSQGLRSRPSHSSWRWGLGVAFCVIASFALALIVGRILSWRLGYGFLIRQVEEKSGIHGLWAAAIVFALLALAVLPRWGLIALGSGHSRRRAIFQVFLVMAGLTATAAALTRNIYFVTPTGKVLSERVPAWRHSSLRPTPCDPTFEPTTEDPACWYFIDQDGRYWFSSKPGSSREGMPLKILTAVDLGKYKAQLGEQEAGRKRLAHFQTIEQLSDAYTIYADETTCQANNGTAMNVPGWHYFGGDQLKPTLPPCSRILGEIKLNKQPPPKCTITDANCIASFAVWRTTGLLPGQEVRLKIPEPVLDPSGQTIVIPKGATARGVVMIAWDAEKTTGIDFWVEFRSICPSDKACFPFRARLSTRSLLINTAPVLIKTETSYPTPNPTMPASP